MVDTVPSHMVDVVFLMEAFPTLEDVLLLMVSPTMVFIDPFIKLYI
jgi:hypothetical protein